MFRFSVVTFTFIICFLVPVASVAGSKSNSYAKLLPNEKEIVDCNAKFDQTANTEQLAGAYLIMRGKGPLDGIKVADKDKAELQRHKNELLEASFRHIFASEVECVMRSMPRLINGDARIETVAKALVDQGLADQIILDAEKYVPNEFFAAKSNEVRLKRNQVERALLAFDKRPRNGKFDGIISIRNSYYICRFERSEKQCMTPIAKKVLAKYANL